MIAVSTNSTAYFGAQSRAARAAARSRTSGLPNDSRCWSMPCPGAADRGRPGRPGRPLRFLPSKNPPSVPPDGAVLGAALLGERKGARSDSDAAEAPVHRVRPRTGPHRTAGRTVERGERTVSVSFRSLPWSPRRPGAAIRPWSAPRTPRGNLLLRVPSPPLATRALPPRPRGTAGRGSCRRPAEGS